jgi:hypothetical protein
MEVKLKNIEITVSVYKKLPDIGVIAGIHYNCDKQNLVSLKTNTPPAEITNGAESACVAYALFENIRDSFVGTPLDIVRTRVSRVDCDCINGKFVITWNCQGTGSALRKTMGLYLKHLDPAKLYSKYAENIKLLGGKSDRDVFNYFASEMAAAINNVIKFAVVGKINIDADKLKELVSKAHNKQATITKLPKEVSKPDKHSDFVQEYPHIKVKGIAAAAIADYIKSKSGGMGVSVFTDMLVVYNHSWKTKQTALKSADKIKDFISQKYAKIGADFYNVFAYMCITQGYAECCTVTQILKTKPNAAAMVEFIKKNL